MKCIQRRRARALLAAAVSLGIGQQLLASLSFDQSVSSLKITHDADITNPNDVPFVRQIVPIQRSTQIFPTNPYQMNDHVFATGASSTTATGSLGHVSNATTASLTLSPGTGIVQIDPATEALPNGNYGGASSLKFNFDLRWRVGDGGAWGPLANGYSSFVVGGVIGDGGSATVNVNMRWRNAGGTDLRSEYIDSRPFVTPGPFTSTFTTSRVLNSPTGSLPPNSLLRLSGSIEFLVSNAGGPTNINPLRVEVGGLPPTGHFKLDQSGDYLNPDNWESHDIEEDGLRGRANAAGDRAVFFSTSGSKDPSTVFISENITLGTLDVGGNAPYVFANGEVGGINFTTTNDENAKIITRGSASHSINVPISMGRTLDLFTDQRTGLVLANSITGDERVNKRGSGTALLNASSPNFAGLVNVDEGSLVANERLSLGLGSVHVGRGTLHYNAIGASAQVVDVIGGMLELNVVPEGDRFSIGTRGAIGGLPAGVSKLVVGQDLQLAPNAMIVHSDPENVQNGNPQNLGTQPLYLFGITGAIPVGELTVGSQSGTPWAGVGAVGEAEFGGETSVLQLAGNATVSALPGSSLNINSKVLGGATTMLQKLGEGTVKLAADNRTYTGLTEVREGALLVNGTLGGNVDLIPGGTIGGKGVIAGALESEFGGEVAPGDGGVGTLTVGTLSLASGTSLSFDIDTPSASDQILIAGNLILDGELFVNIVEGVVPGRYPIMQYSGLLDDRGLEIGFAPDDFEFEIVVEESPIILLGKGGDGFLAAASGGTVFLVVTPEPGILGMMGMGAMGLVARRRRVRR